MNANRFVFREGFQKVIRTLSVSAGSSFVACQLWLSSKDENSSPTSRFHHDSLFHTGHSLLEGNHSDSNFKGLNEKTDPTTSTLLAPTLQQRQTCLYSKAVKKIQQYDFVVVGCGNAGESALLTLQKLCPQATIAIIDPLRSPNKGKNKVDPKTDYFKDAVVEFDGDSKSIKLLNHHHPHIGYKHGILIATGARGAPPPPELFQKESLPRVLELRPTEVLETTQRPIMAPEKVRKALTEAAGKGARIGIVGSGWEALDLLLLVEQASKKQKPPSICFASQGIAWHILPPYLSAELRKKLQKKRIDLQDRSVVRYVADYQSKNSHQVELHSAKSYDLLDTQRTVLDLLVIAPDSFGEKGTAALATLDLPKNMKELGESRPWYKTWSQLGPSQKIVCFEDDGRIAVNPELTVASKIYAAGGCAKYPNSSTGHSSIAGEGPMDGSQAGRVAAKNMSLDYRTKKRRRRKQRKHTTQKNEDESTEESMHSFVSLPIWRSDVTSYPALNGDRSSSLSSIGIQALCVGKCDSEKQSTRAFWWTNSSAQRKMNRYLNAEEESTEDAPVVLQRRKSILVRNKRGGLPIYGMGVVFYLDFSGRLQGIMTWGLPFESSGGRLNPDLVDCMKELIRTNAGLGGLSAEDTESFHQILNRSLGKASQRLVYLAMKDQDGPSNITQVWHGLEGSIEGYSTPLYRYTEVPTGKSKTMNVLKRNDGSGLGVLGEGLYARDEPMEKDWEIDQNSAPTNLPTTMYPIVVAVSNEKGDTMESMQALRDYLKIQKQWEANENRARPGKEDLLWLRPGDERKTTSGKQNVIDAYKRVMFPHRSE